MINHLKTLTDGILNGTIRSGDLFRTHKEIYLELQGLSAEQFAEAHQVEFTMARGMFAHLSKPNLHEVIDGTKVIAAAKRLRPVLDHFIGSKPTTSHGVSHVNLTTIQGDQHVGDKINIGGNVTGSAVGSKASLKARDIVTSIQQSGLDNDLKQKFEEAAEELTKLNIDEGDKEDAADDIKKLQDELEKPTKNEGRVQKIWGRIKGAAPTVASILASAASLGKIVGVVP